MSEVCPKCGSDQIQHDQCLKCGVIISKAKGADPRKASVSFVSPAPPQPAKPEPRPSYVWQPPTMKDGIVTFSASKKLNNLKTNLLTALVLLVIAGIAFKTYKFFVHQASTFSGQYRNTRHIFTLRIPDKGWSHYSESDLKDVKFKEAIDGFYYGNDPDDPNVVMVIWTEDVHNPVPSNLDNRTAAELLKGIEAELVKRMEKSELKCEVTQARKQYVGGRDGFILRADLTGKRSTARTILYCAFDTGRAFTIQFIGTEKHLMDQEKAIEEIMNSFVFDARLF